MGSNRVTDPKTIEEQLHRILSSPEFDATARQKKFLRYVTQMFLEGRAGEIKGYTVATDVFDRKTDFDPSTDPIVSVEARRLRRALEHYYLTAGRRDRVRITIPKGSYVPSFLFQTGADSSRSSPKTEPNNNERVDHWPSVLIRPFQSFSEGTGPNYVAEGCMTELAIELSRYQDIRVLMKPSDPGGQSIKEPTTRFYIEGSVRYGRHNLNVAVQLFDQQTHRQVWGDVYEYDMKTNDLMAFQRETAQIIAAKIAQEQGHISQTLSLESQNKPPAEMDTYEALLRFYKHEVTFTSETLKDALAALEEAAVREPECSQVWTCLGLLYCENYTLESIERQTPVEKAIQFSEKGVRLNPSNQRARVALAMARLLNNQLTEGLVEARNALALNPNSLIFMDTIGHVLAPLGDWDLGTDLINKAIKLNPYHRPFVYHVLCADWLRKREYERAYLETLNFRLPSAIWDPLLQASTLGLLGRTKEGSRFAEALLTIKPDFPTRGRTLIKRWVKSDELAECMINGLKKSGLQIK
jgi:TolB-like protein/cytochrome c-type biogenesis protein CcmH/NrfG